MVPRLIRLRKLCSGMGQLVRSNFYIGMYDAEEFNKVKPLIDLLTYNGFSLSRKVLKEFNNGKRKANADVEIAVDMMRLSPHIDHFILCSGDGDFCYLLEALQTMGKRVTVISTAKLSGDKKVLSDDLRKQADNFVDLADCQLALARDAKTRVQAGIARNRDSRSETGNAET